MLALGHDDLGEKVHKQVSNYFFESFLPLHPGDNIQKLQKEFTQFTHKIDLLPSLASERVTKAFTHKSFAHELGNTLAHNEVLEFLGDAVLELVVTEVLLENYPTLEEGKLSKLRSSIVNEKTLSSLAQTLKLSEFILVGKGELKSKGYEKSSLLSNTLEALLGAIYQEHGFMKAKEFFIKLTQNLGEDIWSLDTLLQFDAKSRLQELTMKKFKITPRYECTNSDDQSFAITCFLGETLVATHSHISKKKGMQELAYKILNEQLLDTMEISC